MSSIKDEYLLKKSQILAQLNEAEKFFREKDDMYSADIIASQRNDLENGEFSIAVVGEFSSGKSTLLNALMREKLLPSFSDETTATINYLRHISRSPDGCGGCVHFRDGSSQTFDKVTLENVERFGSTISSDVQVAQEVSSLELFLDSKYLDGNVTLVDTPGLNGNAEGHKEITAEQIEKSSAGIFVFDANQPGSATDFMFLSELRRHVKSIFLVINKIDDVNPAEQTLDDVLEKLKENYRKSVPEEETVPEILPVSAARALIARSSKKLFYHERNDFTPEEMAIHEKESRMDAFEERIWRFLTCGEKAKQELLAPLDHLIAKLDAAKNLNDTEKKALEGDLSGNDLAEQCQKLEQSLGELEEKKKKAAETIIRQVVEAEKSFIEAVNASENYVRDKIGSLLDTFTNIEDIEPQNIDRRIKLAYIRCVDNAYADYINKLRDILREYTDSTLSDIKSSLDISLTGELSLPKAKVGYEEYEKRKKALEASITALEEEISGDSVDAAKKRALVRERGKNEKKLDRLELHKREMIELRDGSIPSVDENNKKVIVERPATGVFQKIGKYLFGAKYDIDYTTEKDFTARNAYQQETAERRREFDERIRALEKKIDSLPSDSAEADELLEQKNKLLDRKNHELSELNKKFIEHIRKTEEELLVKQKAEIALFIEEQHSSLMKECRQFLVNERSVRADTIAEFATDDISEQIAVKIAELDAIRAQCRAAEQEKRARIARIDEENAKIADIFRAANMTKISINSIPTDSIDEEYL